MSDRLTDAELDRLEILYMASAPGPWLCTGWNEVIARGEGEAVVVSESSNQVHTDLIATAPVSYTHLTLPTKRIV